MTFPLSIFNKIKEEKGVVVGCDLTQEWLLPWWWTKYAECNEDPVAFIDFGMSVEMRKFCQERGELFVLHDPVDFLLNENGLSSELATLWESVYKKEIWNHRKGWFKKPLAMALSPFQRSVWMDLDCEVVGSIAPLFNLDMGADALHFKLEGGHLPQIAMAKEPECVSQQMLRQKFLLPEETLYNSGVVVFDPSSSIIHHWIRETITRSDKFMGDQNLLSRLIFERKFHVYELPEIYNWRVFADNGASQVMVHPQAVIVHWAHEWGKQHIHRYGGLGPEFRQWIRNWQRSASAC